jgi:NADPH:quinone reductase-like Zn-dependent oxidoreductase
MRAVTVDVVPSVPEVTEVTDPVPEPGEIVVRVVGSSINGFDAKTLAGRFLERMEHRFPLIPGCDFAGFVEQLGLGVTDYRVGDAVFGVVVRPYLGAGSFAERVAVSTGHGVTALPAGFPVGDAGALGLAGTTAWAAVRAVAPEPGQIVLVSGATGGVGALATQLLVRRGARVLATARPGPETDFVLGLIDGEVTAVDFTGDLSAQVRVRALDGVDAVLHFAGDGPALAPLVRPGGRIASTVGFLPDRADVRGTAVRTDPSRETLDRLASDAVSGVIRVPITAGYPLDLIAKAFTDFGHGALGKLAVTVD